MAWRVVSYTGVSEIHFSEKGMKIKAKVYQKTILELLVKPLNINLFKENNWTNQQDSVPTHKTFTIKQWWKDNVADFTENKKWPPSSPDLSPLNFKLYGVL
ncbi:putative MhmaT1 transposase [Trichonephila clavipes]|nr:putative MhmaT1 transposase [Trichonephila clavipes]